MRDYQGAFNPELCLSDLDHALLARYARDIMLANHIHDRSALMPVALKFGLEVQTQVACDEWMSASPIYNQRNRRALDIQGDDVGAALKGFQFDIGAPHNYLNFHYELVSPSEGYFWTNTCGPFNHVYEMTGGDETMQTQICHHMEDPTFDATVIAVNPHMRCRPVFRPPVGAIPETGPCRWRVTIENDIVLAEDCPFLADTSATLAANFVFQPCDEKGPGLQDYRGAFKRDLCLEDLSPGTLRMMCQEFMLDVLLLNYACHNAVSERCGEEHLVSLAAEQWHHLAPVTVHRLRATFGIQGNGVTEILKVLQLNPFIPREYVDLQYAQLSDNLGLIWLSECAAHREPRKRGLVSLMMLQPESPGFHRLAQEVNARAVVKAVDVSRVPRGVDTAQVKSVWEVFIDDEIEPAQRSEYADAVGNHMWDLDNSRHRYVYEQYDAVG
ncbi:MAG: hypothetical protein AAGA91_10040 [Pseudomonadota bacterium]